MTADGAPRPSASGPGFGGGSSAWKVDAELPIFGSTVVDLPISELWAAFVRVRDWSRWNPCIWRATVRGGSPVVGAQLIWAFNPIRGRYLYRLPAVARLVEVIPERRMTWEVTALPGFRARHTYWMEPIDERHSRFGSWEVAQGPIYRLLRRFWLATFRYVCRESLRGARELGARG